MPGQIGPMMATALPPNHGSTGPRGTGDPYKNPGAGSDLNMQGVVDYGPPQPYMAGSDQHNVGPQMMQQPMYAGNPAMGNMPVGRAVPAIRAVDGESKVRGVDSLNAPAPFVRPSLHRLPASQSIRSKAAIPLGFVLQPMREGEGIPEVPLVNFGTTKVPRCVRCRAYVNPFVMWEAGGRRWNCNICGFGNDTVAGYFCPLDETNQRQDRFTRPELRQGSVEIVASGDYMTRPPMAPAFIALIDVSLHAISSGFTDTVCQSLKHVISSEALLHAQGDRVQFGIITYDSSIHFYNIKASLTRPQIFVVTSLTDVFLPLSEGILVPVIDCGQTIVNLLDSLPSYWRNRSSVDSCATVALGAAQTLLKNVGGKVLMFMSTFPTLGEHKLNPTSREKADKKSKSAALPDDIDFLKPAHDQYYSVAHQMAMAQIGCDIFVAPPNMQSMDLSTLSQAAECTGGEVFFYPGFKSETSGDKLRQEIVANLSRTSGWECVVRVRISKGWTISRWFGHHFFRGADLMIVPQIPENHTCSVLIDCQDSVVTEPFLYLQSAVLYTHSKGERRIRVHTFCLPTTSKLSDIAASIDVDVAAHLVMLRGMKAAMVGRIADGRAAIQSSCTSISSFLASNYPAQFTPPHPQDPFVPLDNHPAVQFTVACLGMLKCGAFREANDIPPDLRHFYWLRMTAIGVDSSHKFFSPNLYPVHELQNAQSADGCAILPQPLRLTNRLMTSEGAYIVDDGEALYFWIGRSISSQWLKEVLGLTSLEQLAPEYVELILGTTGTPAGTRLSNIIDVIRKTSSSSDFLKLNVFRQGDPLEYRFFYSLIEDRGHAQGVSLHDFWQKFGPRVSGPASGSAAAGVSAMGSFGEGTQPFGQPFGTHMGGGYGIPNQPSAYLAASSDPMMSSSNKSAAQFQRHPTIMAPPPSESFLPSGGPYDSSFAPYGGGAPGGQWPNGGAAQAYGAGGYSGQPQQQMQPQQMQPQHMPSQMKQSQQMISEQLPPQQMPLPQQGRSQQQYRQQGPPPQYGQFDSTAAQMSYAR